MCPIKKSLSIAIATDFMSTPKVFAAWSVVFKMHRYIRGACDSQKSYIKEIVRFGEDCNKRFNIRLNSCYMLHVMSRVIT